MAYVSEVGGSEGAGSEGGGVKGGGLHLTCTCIRNVCTTLVHKYSK